MQQTMATSATNFQTALTNSGNTATGPLTAISTLLSQYATLIPAAIKAMQFLDQYQTAIAEDAAGAMLWAVKDTDTPDEVRLC